MSEIKDSIKQFLSDELLVDFSDHEITEETNLFEAGMVDSYGFVELVSHIENHWKIKLSNREIMNQEFSSLNGFTAATEHVVAQKEEA